MSKENSENEMFDREFYREGYHRQTENVRKHLDARMAAENQLNGLLLTKTVKNVFWHRPTGKFVKLDYHDSHDKFPYIILVDNPVDATLREVHEISITELGENASWFSSTDEVNPDEFEIISVSLFFRIEPKESLTTEE